MSMAKQLSRAHAQDVTVQLNTADVHTVHECSYSVDRASSSFGHHDLSFC